MIRYEATLASGADAQLSAELDEWDEPTVPGLLGGVSFPGGA